jgi:hypothetical protein
VIFVSVIEFSVCFVFVAVVKMLKAFSVFRHVSKSIFSFAITMQSVLVQVSSVFAPLKSAD